MSTKSKINVLPLLTKDELNQPSMTINKIKNTLNTVRIKTDNLKKKVNMFNYI